LKKKVKPAYWTRVESEIVPKFMKGGFREALLSEA
jgi:hypothetical protein